MNAQRAAPPLTHLGGFASLRAMLRLWASLALVIVLFGGAIGLAHAHGPGPERAQLEHRLEGDHDGGCTLCSQGRLTLATFASAPLPVAPLSPSGTAATWRVPASTLRDGTGARSPPTHS